MSRYAAIDVGTNSVLLLVAEKRAGRFVAVQERADITRLGRGVDRTRTLAPEAIEATLATIARFAQEARALGAAQLVVSATSAARDASNGQAFLDGAKERAGVEVEVISGEEEARLSFSSAHADFGGQRPLVVLDIGGGSTEFIYGAPDGTVSFRRSFDVGAVRLTERHLRQDPPHEDELQALDEALAAQLSELPPPPLGARLVGVAGSITTLAAVSLQLDVYDAERVHGATLSLEVARGVADRLASLPLRLRTTVPGLQPRRADVIVAGARVLVAAMQAVGATELTVSDRGLRWGLLADRFGSAP